MASKVQKQPLLGVKENDIGKFNTINTQNDGLQHENIQTNEYDDEDESGAVSSLIDDFDVESVDPDEDVPPAHAIDMLELLLLINKQQKEQEKERRKYEELAIKEGMYKRGIILQIISQRPDLQNHKGAMLLKNCQIMPVAYVEALGTVHQKIMQSKAVQDWCNSATGNVQSRLEKPIIEFAKHIKVDSKHVCAKPSPTPKDIAKQIVKDLDLPNFIKTVFKAKESKTHGLDDILMKDIQKAAKELLSIAKNVVSVAAKEVVKEMEGNAKNKGIQTPTTGSWLEKLHKQREGAEKQKSVAGSSHSYAVASH